MIGRIILVWIAYETGYRHGRESVLAQVRATNAFMRAALRYTGKGASVHEQRDDPTKPFGGKYSGKRDDAKGWTR